MARYDFSAPRLFVDQALAGGVDLVLDRNQHNYLCNVLRLSEGDVVNIFNGTDGEWSARLGAGAGRRQTRLSVEECVRQQTPPPNIDYLFAPLKHARLDYMVQKAVEMGAGRLRAVTTRRTQATRVNLDRMRANAIEAAEQCGILALPTVEETIALPSLLAEWPVERTLVFCDEDAEGDPIAVLRAANLAPGAPLAVLVGPEGGFAPEERDALLKAPSTLRLALGPRILRADTAAVAALALVQATLGDWPVG